MQSVRGATITLSLFPIFEPTGNIRCQSSDSQISAIHDSCRGSGWLPRGANSVSYRLFPKPRGELFALLEQFLRHNTAEGIEKRFVLGELSLPLLVIDPENFGNALVVDVEAGEIEIVWAGQPTNRRFECTAGSFA